MSTKIRPNFSQLILIPVLVWFTVNPLVPENFEESNSTLLCKFGNRVQCMLAAGYFSIFIYFVRIFIKVSFAISIFPNFFILFFPSA